MSYAGELKTTILGDEPKDLCCARACLLGMTLPTATVAGDEISCALTVASSDFFRSLAERVYHTEISVENRRGGGGACRVSFRSKAAAKLLCDPTGDALTPTNIWKCPSCSTYFLRGLFLACGYICDPAKELRLEWSPGYRSEQIAVLLGELGFTPLRSKRARREVFFFRSGALLMDLLGKMQLLDAMYALSDALIIRDLKNQETRSTNCIIKNLRVSSDARTEQIKVVRRLRDKNLLTSLPDDLRRTAELLIENSDDSLAQLAMKSVPPLTKSGVYHRLLKIMRYAEEVLPITSE